MATFTSSVGIDQISSYLPETILSNEEIIERFDFPAGFLEEKLAIQSRHIASADESCSDMAVAAVTNLFESGHASPSDIGLLIVCTQNPDYRLPSTANIVQDRLKLPNAIAAFDINQGCSGYIYGLAIATSMMEVHGIDHGLLITSEAYSKVMVAEDRSTVPIFGDGATATLISRGGAGRVGAFTFGSDGSGADKLIVKGGGSRHPGMSVENEGGLYMDGRAIFNFMMEQMPDDIGSCLEKNNLTQDDIDIFAFHQASAFMVSSLAMSMDIPPEKAPFLLQNCGNTVSGTIPMMLEKLWGTDDLQNKMVLASGFGVGLSWASTVINFK